MALMSRNLCRIEEKKIQQDETTYHTYTDRHSPQTRNSNIPLKLGNFSNSIVS
jgi:hypothetical protein